MDMLRIAVPFLPSKPASFSRANAGKGHNGDRGTFHGFALQGRQDRLHLVTSRGDVGFGFVADSGRITPSVGFLPGKSPVLMAY